MAIEDKGSATTYTVGQLINLRDDSSWVVVKVNKASIRAREATHEDGPVCSFDFAHLRRWTR